MPNQMPHEEQVVAIRIIPCGVMSNGSVNGVDVVVLGMTEPYHVDRGTREWNLLMWILKEKAGK